jgi:hypothetical protein
MAGYDNVGSGTAPTASGLSFSLANAGNVVYGLVGGWDGAGRTVTATYNGVAMTQIADTGLSNGNDRLWVFRLVNAPTGTFTMAFTVTGGAMHLLGGGISVTNANTATFSTPVTAVSSSNGTTATVGSQTGTSSGLWVTAVVDGATNTHTAAGDGSHTERADVNLAQGEAFAAGTCVATGSAQTLSWTISSSSGWAMVAVNVQDATPITFDQEGFRFRNDDGSETTATWKAAQDTNITVAEGETFRVRAIVNMTGDPPAKTFSWAYQKIGVGNPVRNIDQFQ